MVDRVIQTAVWDGLLDSARASRYVEEVLNKHLQYRRRKRLMSGFTGIFVSVLATGSLFLDSVDRYMIIVSALMLIASVLIDTFWKEKSEILSAVKGDFAILHTKYRNLFDQIFANKISEEEAWTAHVILQDLYNQANKSSDVTVDEELRTKTQRDAFKIEAQRYAQNVAS